MASDELHLELLLGKAVRDPQGRRVGRIEEVRAEQQGDQWVVCEYLVGAGGLLERLSAQRIGLWLLSLLGARKNDQGYRVPWQQLDLSDGQRPQLRCPLTALQHTDPADQHG